MGDWARDIITWGLGILSALLSLCLVLFTYIFQSVLKSIDARFAARVKIEEEMKEIIEKLQQENNQRFDSSDAKIEAIDRSLYRLHYRIDADSDRRETGRQPEGSAKSPRLSLSNEESHRPSEEE